MKLRLVLYGILKKNALSGIFLMLLLHVFSVSSYAVPSAPIEHVLKQSNGSKFSARQWGDEWNHGWETVDGFTIILNTASSTWMYAAPDADGSITPTTQVVGQDLPPENVSKHIRPAKVIPSPELPSKSTAPDIPQSVVPPTGTGNIPVVLANFSNTSATYTTTDFSSLLFGTGNNSMKDYYEEVSYNNFSVSAGPAGVRGWYTAANTHDYYGTNVNGNDAHPAELVIEAIAVADAYIDFSAYDGDGDCYVDVVAVVHQGEGEEASGTANDIWSHRWNLYSANYYGDGTGVYTTNDTAACGSIKIDDYIIQPEKLWGQMQTMGVFAHEYGHALGLPDLYDTDGSSEGIGNWGLMAGGSWNYVSRSGDRPAHLSAWCKYWLGWVQPTIVGSTLFNESIAAASDQADVYQLLAGSPSSGGEYFLIENRQKTGFDAGLPGGGLAIWHIDEAKSNNNAECETASGCSTNHYKVALEQADGLFDLEKKTDRGDTGDLFVSGSDFTSVTTPNSLTYAGVNNSLSVTAISAATSVMTATISGASQSQPPVVSNPDPANGVSVTAGSSGQLFRVTAPGATSGRIYYDDDSDISFNIAATVNGDYLEVTIPYTSGSMNDDGANYWYVEATNASGTTRYLSSGNLSFTVTPQPTPPVVSNPNPANGASVIAGSSGQLLKVTAPGATSGTIYYDDDSDISFNIAATVNGDYLEVTIPYTSGSMKDDGVNYWYVEATNASGTTRYPASGNLFFTVTPQPQPPVVSSPDPANGATVAAGSSGQLLKVTAPGATSGIIYYDDDSVISFNAAATVNGDYLEVTIPYTGGIMKDDGINYWYVEATNASGTTRYPASGNMSFTVTPQPRPPVVSNPNPANGTTVTAGSSGQLLKVTAPGATSGIIYYDDDSVISFNAAVTVNGDYLEVTIPYTGGIMKDDGINYWYVEATNTSGTTRYPASGNLSFTVEPKLQGSNLIPIFQLLLLKGDVPGQECDTGKVFDCVLLCVDAATAQSWTGDGVCDDGTWGMTLTCPAFNNDGGDCE